MKLKSPVVCTYLVLTLLKGRPEGQAEVHPGDDRRGWRVVLAENTVWWEAAGSGRENPLADQAH